MRISAGTDAELARQARAGDREAFAALVNRHAAMVRRIARAVLRHPDDADDAAQDAFLSAWQTLERFDPDRPFHSWLARLAVNAARDLRRRRRVRNTESIPVDFAAGGPGPDTEAHAAVLKERLDEALGSLTERQRTALVLYEVEGFSQAEIAEMTGVPEGTTRSDLFHARRRLRPLLET